MQYNTTKHANQEFREAQKESKRRNERDRERVSGFLSTSQQVGVGRERNDAVSAWDWLKNGMINVVLE
jgi:hypothetical protein